MGLFSFLSAGKAADNIASAIPKVIDGAVRGIDSLVFTDEERSSFIKDLLKQLYDNFMPRAISRRVLAVIVFSVFSIFALTGLVFACFEKTNIVKIIIDVAVAFKLGWLTMTITAFYFGVWPFVTKKGK